MTRPIRRELRFLQAYAATTTIANASTSSTPISTLLMISNKDRMHPGVIDGKTLQLPRPDAGFIFFTVQGGESGGLTFRGREENGRRVADSRLMFDRLRQDQTIGFDYSEQDRQRSAGFTVWDRPESPLADLIAQVNAANAIANESDRAALAKIDETAPKSAQRTFVGRTRDRASTVRLSDAQRRARLTREVDADGAAAIESLDANGTPVRRVTSDGE